MRSRNKTKHHTQKSQNKDQIEQTYKRRSIRKRSRNNSIQHKHNNEQIEQTYKTRSTTKRNRNSSIKSTHRTDRKTTRLNKSINLDQQE